MNGWRFGVAVVLLLLIGVPLALPLVDVVVGGQGWQAWAESGRLAELAGNTLRLVVGTLALALPAGVAGAVLLYRTDLPLRGLWKSVTILTLFVPLPLFASAWQAALGTGGWLPLSLWSTAAPGDPDVAPTGLAWKPWAQGLPAAIWIHAIAALPWVVLIVGQALCWVESELEEDALTVAGPWRVLRAVTLPRARAAIWAAAIWVALQTATEITVTDMFQVRTFAEEVYYQFVLGDQAALARAVAVNIPLAALAVLVVLWGASRLGQTLPALESLSSRPLIFPLGGLRWPWFALVCLIAGLLAGIPLASLVWKAGLAGNPETWSADVTWLHVVRVFRAQGGMVAQSLLYAGLAGAVTAGLALVSCWLATESAGFRTGVLFLMAVAWALPAPVAGIGLKETINLSMDAEDATMTALGMADPPPATRDAVPVKRKPSPLQVALYDGPSPLPILWAALVRFFPFAVALLWPIVRQLPPELRDAARVDGATAGQELRRVVWPLLAPACGSAGLAVAILALGEVSAGKLVETPGTRTFAHELFNQMHYGVSNNVAALCLVLLLMVFGAGTLLLVSLRARGFSPR